jgi:hypothetical protein
MLTCRLIWRVDTRASESTIEDGMNTRPRQIKEMLRYSAKSLPLFENRLYL